MGYKYFNANTRGNFVNDCTIRAISLAEGKSWQETYDELSYIAGQNGIILDDVNFIKPFLDSRYYRIRFDEVLVGDFAKNHHSGIYLITMNGHITCCVDGTIFDTFDCRSRTIENVWKVE